MNENEFKVVVIGAGDRAEQVIYPSLASFEDVEIVAICDVDTARVNKIADKYNIKRRYGKSFNDYQNMINDVKPDAVFAIGQPHTMYDIWKWCLERGLNLFIEKPLGITIHQARSLTYLAEKNGCITQVAFQDA